MLEQYKLVGTMNIFGLIPDFVYPIFESKGKYFFQNSDNCLNIDSFDEIYGENNINRINLLDTANNRLIGIKECYSIGDEPVIAFQFSQDDYFIGTIDGFNNIMKDIKFEDQILSEDITDFLNEVKMAKVLKK